MASDLNVGKKAFSGHVVSGVDKPLTEFVTTNQTVVVNVKALQRTISHGSRSLML